MPVPEPIKFGFNVPFHEAIAAMTARGVVLPDVYYGVLQGIARQKAFSIAGITALDQLTAVSDSLKKYIAEGGSFNNWKKEQAVVDLELSKARLDNIWRTNLQGQYMAGKWEQFNRNAKTSPFLMYDAINDSRVRPSHLALDGIIRPVGDAFWAAHSPPCGYRCRCSLISLSPKQAQDRSKDGKGLNQQPILKDGSPALPDKGWDYDKTNRMAGIEKAIEDRKTAAGSNWFKRTLLEQIERKIAQQVKVIESSTFEKQMIDKAVMLEKLDYESALTQVKQGLESAAFAEFYHGEFKGNYPVGVLSESDRELLNAKTKTVLLSRTSLDEHKVSHPDIGLEDYRKIAYVIESGQVWQVPKSTERVIFMVIGDTTYRAAVKTTRDKKENYFLSLFKNTKAKPPKGAIRIR